MASDIEENCPINCETGIYEMPKEGSGKSAKEHLEEKGFDDVPILKAYANDEFFKKMKKAKRTQKSVNVFVLGQDIATMNAYEAAKKLKERDFPNLLNGATIIPTVFTSKDARIIVDPKKEREKIKVRNWVFNLFFIFHCLFFFPFFFFF